MLWGRQWFVTASTLFAKHTAQNGSFLLQLDDPDVGTLDYRYFATHQSDARSPNYINLREVSQVPSVPALQWHSGFNSH